MEGLGTVLKVKAKFLDEADSALSRAAFSRSALSRSIRAVMLSIIWPLKDGPLFLSVAMCLAATTAHLAGRPAVGAGVRKLRSRHLEVLFVRFDILPTGQGDGGQLDTDRRNDGKKPDYDMLRSLRC